MSYSNEPSGSVAVDHTPSLVFNNLTTNGERVVRPPMHATSLRRRAASAATCTTWFACRLRVVRCWH